MRSTTEKGQLKSGVTKKLRHFPPTKIEDGKTKLMIGDNRGCVHPGFIVIQTLFLRNHNRIAKNLARLNPNWVDEKVYQEARKINSAIYQHIVFTEFLPALFGNDPEIVNLPEEEYNPEIDGTMRLPFSTASYR